MSWVRLDDGFAEHPKIVSLTDREFRLWVALLCYCARQEDPTVDRLTARAVRGLTPRLIAKLESIGLLDLVENRPENDPTFDSVSLTKTTKNTYEIHDWIHYQPKDKTGAERQARYRSRRLEQADDPRYAAVTPTVTESVTPDRYSDRNENVTPVPVPGQTPEGSSVSEDSPSFQPNLANTNGTHDDNIDFDPPPATTGGRKAGT